MRLVVAVVLLCACAPSVSAQQRPLVTEDPETIGGGRILIEAGLDVEHDIFFPASGLTGDLFRAPTLGVSIGLSSIAELQLDGAVYQRLAIEKREPAPFGFKLRVDGDSTSDVEDLEIATKLNGMTLQFERNVGEDEKLFGSVTNRDIAEQLKKAGIEIDHRWVALEAPVKALGKYETNVRLAAGVIAAKWNKGRWKYWD
jgi:hypothetical protein